ncbi:MAG: putative baseplate assembly protein, partial [Candidatus Neomarinimicrobiota bacterium]
MSRKSEIGSLAETNITEREPAVERHYNRPGLPAVTYRSSNYATALFRMLEQLSKQNIPPGEYSGSRPLQGLSTQAKDDPAIALLDSWAIVQDILTFYQERIANEGYLNTATERRSVHALTRSIGYELDPGVAAGTQLA